MLTEQELEAHRRLSIEYGELREQLRRADEVVRDLRSKADHKYADILAEEARLRRK